MRRDSLKYRVRLTAERVIHELEEARTLTCELGHPSLTDGGIHHLNDSCFTWDTDALDELLIDMRRRYYGITPA